MNEVRSNAGMSLMSEVVENSDMMVSGNVVSMDDVSELRSKLDTLQQAVDCIPGIVADAIISAFVNMRFTDVDLDAFVLDNNGQVAKDGYSAELRANIKVRGDTLLDFIATSLESDLRSSVNYDGMHALKARVKQLEEDLGYREAVAHKLMEDYPNAQPQSP